jgi:hypothetical protein
MTRRYIGWVGVVFSSSAIVAVTGRGVGATTICSFQGDARTAAEKTAPAQPPPTPCAAESDPGDIKPNMYIKHDW